VRLKKAIALSARGGTADDLIAVETSARRRVVAIGKTEIGINDADQMSFGNVPFGESCVRSRCRIGLAATYRVPASRSIRFHQIARQHKNAAVGNSSAALVEPFDAGTDPTKLPFARTFGLPKRGQSMPSVIDTRLAAKGDRPAWRSAMAASSELRIEPRRAGA